jgi:hypothetical protein
MRWELGGIREAYRKESEGVHCGLKKDERRTFNAQHRMLNVKTRQVFYWKFGVGRSMLNVH